MLISLYVASVYSQKTCWSKRHLGPFEVTCGTIESSGLVTGISRNQNSESKHRTNRSPWSLWIKYVVAVVIQHLFKTPENVGVLKYAVSN